MQISSMSNTHFVLKTPNSRVDVDMLHLTCMESDEKDVDLFRPRDSSH